MRAYDAILLLGLKLNADGSAPEELLSRVKLARDQFIAGAAPLIVACGGKTSGTPVSEAQVMAQALYELGVDKRAVILEDKSQVTYQNIENARTILKTRLPNVRKPSALIVTSDYHLFRAKYMARTMGFEAYGVSCPTPRDSLFYMRRKLERMFFLNYFMGWETGKRKKPAFYERVVSKIMRV